MLTWHHWAEKPSKPGHWPGHKSPKMDFNYHMFKTKADQLIGSSRMWLGIEGDGQESIPHYSTCNYETASLMKLETGLIQ